MMDVIKNLLGNTKATMSAMIVTTLMAAPLYAGAGEYSGHGDAGAQQCTNCTKGDSGGHGEAKAVPSDPYMLKADPVSGEEFGESPVIVNVHGREIRFANEQTQAKFNENPKIYMHTIDQMMIEQQLPLYPLDTCVISGDKLGGDMGEPVEFVYGNQLVRFCCKGCKKEFLKDPAKHLAKIDAAVIAKQHYPLTTCVVSGEELGGDMGEPIEYVAGNRLVRLCCKGCKKQFNKAPLAFLDKISEASGHEKTGGHAQKDSDADSSSGHGQHGHGQH